MNILSQLKKNFDTFIIDFYNKSDQYCLNLISKMLEELDLELAATRRKSLIKSFITHIKSVERQFSIKGK